MILLVAWWTPSSFAQDGRPLNVEPGELLTRPDLVGKEVVVDDRVGRYQYHPEKKIDQIYIRRAPDLPFELPERIRPAESPRQPGVIIRGTVRKEAGRLYVDVTSFEPVPADIDRLSRGMAILSKADIKARRAWSAWAARRAKAFDDEPLARKAREIEQETIIVEAERPAGRDPQGHWLALADRARQYEVDNFEVAALAHRGLRLALATAKTPPELEALVTRIESYLTTAKDPAEAPPDMARWARAYTADPWAGYRTASEAARAVLDHGLWADAVQALLERRASMDHSFAGLIALSDEAARRLPDRLKIAEAFLEKGIALGAKDVTALRQREVDGLAALYRDRLHQPEKALALYRAWLDDQRLRGLSKRDADGRIALAHQYETLLDDRTTAVALLNEASNIDPNSRDLNEAFLRRGYRKVKGTWVEASKTRAEESTDRPTVGPGAQADEPEPAVAARGDKLRHATPQEVRARLGGKPDRVVRSSTRGQLLEQWIYFGKGQNQYINFVRKSGDLHPRVVAYYSLPTSLTEIGADP